MPEMSDLLYGSWVKTYPYEKTFEEARHDPFVVCHTSETIGPPKLVTLTHGTLAVCDAFGALPASGYPPTFVEAMRGKRVLAGVPPFQWAGVFLRLAMPLFYDCTAVECDALRGPPLPLTADAVNEMHVHGNISISVLQPNIWDEIAKNPKYLDQLSSLEYAMNVAWALPKDLGDIIATKTSVVSFMGSTETLLLPIEYPDHEDWDYIRFSDCMGAKFCHYHEDLYQLVMVRDPMYQHYQSIFFTYPEEQEYSMKDLYSPHPTKPGLWTYRGRNDDVLVIEDGQKMLPIAMEDIINGHPEVRSALVFTLPRLKPVKPGLLIEAENLSLTWGKDQVDLLDRIWPTIDRANQRYNEALRVSRNDVVFTSPGRPMLRRREGGVHRIKTMVSYFGFLYFSNQG